MGRLEDALLKLRKAGSAQSEQRPPLAPTPRLAQVVANDHAYAGKRVEIDLGQLRAQGLLAPDLEERRLEEQYRVIKRPLLKNASPTHVPVVERGNLLMVASALSGEGKTFTCVNLCLSIAREKDWNVVLVDGDCSKPHLTRLFSAEKEPGLIDLLREPDLRFDSLVMPTDIPGLSLLPSGSRDLHAAELLASKRMDDLCSELALNRSGRLVIFDSSPLLLTTEAAVLASKVGQIVLVVRANATPRQAVMAAVAKLETEKAIGCVLNQTYGKELGSDYGQYYGYGD